MRIFIFPAIVSIVAFAAVLAWGGLSALFLVVLLTILETTLSFDNAVVNAKVLKRMTPQWQSRFLTWGHTHRRIRHALHFSHFYRGRSRVALALCGHDSRVL
jgi:hypothetical protein